MFRILLLLSIFCKVSFCQQAFETDFKMDGVSFVSFETDFKMDGVSFVSPSKNFPSEYLLDVKKVNADWLAISPFAFSKAGKPSVTFNSNFQWWGETATGTNTIIEYAQKANLKILLKPQVWMRNSWVGSYKLENESDWLKWERDYESYILTFAKIAATKNVDVFCVGTEYKIAAIQREAFWRELICKVREIYTGTLTYASNWDNYQNIPFWDELDFIGIDAYFPLQNAETPELAVLLKNWKPLKNKIKIFAERHQKQIVFTEYGYMSCDYTAWQNWENENNRAGLNVNLKAQSIAYEALFSTFWNEPWFGGGFIWKWYHNYQNSGGVKNKDYTPQNKPVEKVISKWYFSN